MGVPHFRHLLISLALLLLAANGHMLYGQIFPEDVRLSPEEPQAHDVTKDYQIQASDRIANRSLVVWGTTRRLGNGQIVGELRLQMLEGAGPIDSQRVLTDTIARPFGFVQVIPNGSFFLVVWNDRRSDRSGVYAQRISINGERLGNEVRISPGQIVWHPATSGIAVLEVTSTERLLLWIDHRQDSTRLYGLRFYTNGRLELPGFRIAARIQSMLRFSTLPGMTLLQVSDTTGVLIHRNGRIDNRTAHLSRSGTAYNIGPDTSLVTLRGNRLHYYASIFSDTAQWIVDLPMPDSIVPNSGKLARDSAGTIHVYYTTLGITGSDDEAGYVLIREYRVDITGPAEVSVADSVHEERFFNGSYGFHHIVHYTFRGSGYQQGNDNTGSSSLTFSWSHIVPGNPPDFGTAIFYSSIDRLGFFRPDSIGMIPLLLETRSIVSRADRDGLSVVKVEIADTAIELTAPTAPRDLYYPVTRPMLRITDDNLVQCSWFDQHHGPTLARATLPFSAPATILDRLKVEPLRSFSYSSTISTVTSVYCNYRHGSEDLFSSSGFFGYESLHLLTCNVTEYFTPSFAEHYTDYRSFSGLFLPGTNSWNTVLESRTEGRSYTDDPEFRRVWVGGYDPDRGELLVQIGDVASDTRWSIRTIDLSGVLKTDFGPIDFYERPMLLPVDSLRYMRITHDSAITYRQRSVVASFPFSGRDEEAEYQRLYGPYIIRSSRKGVTEQRLLLEIYHVADGIVGSQFVSTIGYSGRVSVVQRRSDSALAVLWGTEGDGIHAAFLDKDLRVIVRDTVVSAAVGRKINPAGIFQNDTLYIAWEDYRNGEAVIYGNRFVPPPIETSSAATNRDPSGALTARLWPNPAGIALNIEFNKPVESAADLELFDLLGSIVWRGEIAVGMNNAVVPLKGERSGAYRLRWRCKDLAGSLPVVVIR